MWNANLLIGIFRWNRRRGTGILVVDAFSVVDQIMPETGMPRCARTYSARGLFFYLAQGSADFAMASPSLV